MSLMTETPVTQKLPEAWRIYPIFLGQNNPHLKQPLLGYKWVSNLESYTLASVLLALFMHSPFCDLFFVSLVFDRVHNKIKKLKTKKFMQTIHICERRR